MLCLGVCMYVRRTCMLSKSVYICGVYMHALSRSVCM